MFRPLSEEEPFSLFNTQEFLAEQGSEQMWDDTVVLVSGEKRHLNLSIRLKQHAKARMMRWLDVPTGASLTVALRVEAESGTCWNSTFLVRGGGEIELRRALHVFGTDVKAEHHCVAMLKDSGRMSAAEEMKTQHSQSELAVRTLFVLNDQSEALVRARVIASPQAHDSVIYEDLQALTLGSGTRMRAIPELEVQTDRIACSHRASSLPIDEAACFYLRSRGLTEPQAQTLLSRSFTAPILERLPEDTRAYSEEFLFSS